MSSVKIIDNKDFHTRFIKSVNYPIARIKYKQPFGVKVESDLPFRVKFTNIGVPSYGPNNPAGIGIAIIGYNNYIL